MSRLRWPRAFALLAAFAPALAPAAAHDTGGMHRPADSQACADLRIACAATITPAVDGDGTLWVAGRVGDRLFVARSGDGGAAFSTPVAIDTGPVTLDWGPDARPQLAVAGNGTLVLAYATFRDDKFDGEIFTARSTDGGRSFSKPQPITDVRESQRFPVIGFGRNGALFAAWLDKRGRIDAAARGKPFTGAGLAVARSVDGGAGIGPTAMVRDGTCECCRIALAFTPDDRPAVMFRNIFPGDVRDHAVITFDAAGRPGPLERVSTDDWKTESCPHQGPSFAIAPDGSYHAAWSTNGRVRRGLFYARSENGGAEWSEPMPLGAPNQASSRPFVLAIGRDVHLAWKSFDGHVTRVTAMASHDGGRHWDPPRTLDQVEGPSDHPMLFARAGRTFLSWQTGRGYRLVPLGAPS